MGEISMHNSPLHADYLRVVKNYKAYFIGYTGRFHTESQDFRITSILAVDRVKDFVNNVGDVIHIEFYMPLGDFIYALYREDKWRAEDRTRLETRLYENLEFTQTTKDERNNYLHERYKAIVAPDILEGMDPDMLRIENRDELNRGDMLLIQMQLVDLWDEPLQMVKVSGVITDEDRTEVLEEWLYNQPRQILVKGKGLVDLVSVYPIDNEERISRLVVPSGTRIADFPKFIQERGGGIYLGGVGSYIQMTETEPGVRKKVWYIYPLFINNVRWAQITKIRMLSYQPKYAMETRYTWWIEGIIIHMVVQMIKKDPAVNEDRIANRPRGISVNDADQMIGDSTTISGGKVSHHGHWVNTHLLAKPRNDEMDVTLDPTIRRTSNFFAAGTNAISNIGYRMDVRWNHGVENIVFPGMGCRVYIEAGDGDILVRNGILLFAHTTTSRVGEGMKTDEWDRSCLLSVYMPEVGQ